jgi:anti-sigma factor RsiW
MRSAHQELRQALGAYTVGALDAEERSEVEAHLAECPTCRDELAGLAVLPGLLGRLSPEEASSGLLAFDAGRAERAIAAAADAQRSARRWLHAWQAAALVAVVALVSLAAVTLPWATGRPDTVLLPQPVAADAGSIDGQVRITEHSWGMEVEAELHGLPQRRGYTLMAVRRDDHRAVAASWTATDTGSVRLTGSCYVDPADLAHFEIVTPDGELMATFEP